MRRISNIDTRITIIQKMQFQKYMRIIVQKIPGDNILMENSLKEVHTPYDGYRGADTAQPHEAPNDFRASSPKSYSPPDSGGYQQQEQFYGPQQHSGYQQPYFEPPASSNSPYEKISVGMRGSRAGWLSYLGGWVTGLIFLLLKREDRLVRFHAMQSLLFFGAMSLVTAMFSYIPFLSSIGDGLGFVSIICWIVLIVKTARGRHYKLPIIGDYAEKWANALRD
jgi:uncharacterized membrane protein